MSDTDDDLVPNSFHKFPHENTVIHTQLPKSSYGSYTNMMTSNFNMPHRFMGFDQRSMYSRRETSPMSLRSFPNSRMPYQQSYPQSAMSSRGSVINARCRSPMSVRSNYSNTTVSAADIALALKNYKFNKNDERMIHDAYTAFKKSRMRKRIGKRRNFKSFLKYCRRNSGGESGAEGSNSSVSSDDCRSTRSAFYTRNIPKVRAMSPRIDLNKFTSQVRENDNYTDCTENIKQNSFRNVITAQSRIVNHSFLPQCKQQNVPYDDRFPDIPKTHKDLCSELQNAPVTLKDRLAKDTSLLLPIQRFNMSNANPTYEISYKVKSKAAPQKEFSSNNQLEESDNESEEIFGPSTSRVNQTLSKTLKQKRVLETESVSFPESKRKKLTTSPVKQNKSSSSKNMKKITTNTKDFNFKKPLLPVRKFGTLVRDNEPEVLIAKSSQPLVGNVESLSNPLKKMPQVVFTSEEKPDTNKQTNQALQNHIDSNYNTVADETQNSTVSTKPSFTKRKLFTQKLDIVENKNISSDNLGVNSPQTKALRACREKNKVRKLTSQSCLSRDISDNNYMDLLHKLLPPDQIKNQTLNNTNVANKKAANKHGDQIKNHTPNSANVANKETSKHGDQIKGQTLKNTKVANRNETSKQSPVKNGKRDVSIVISRCDDDAGSDTYTDEEIFNVTQEDKGKTNAAQNEKQYPVTQLKTTVKSFVKTFWDTDFESDMEDRVTLTSQNNLEKDQIPRNTHFWMNGTNGVGAKNKLRGAILSARNLCNPEMNQSTQSNDTQTLKGKMLDNHKQQENNDTQKLKGKMLVNNKQQENKENVTDYNMLKKSTRSKNKANIHTEPIKSNTNDTDKVSNNLNYKSTGQQSYKVQNPKLRTPSRKNNNKQSLSIFNISRESLRNKKNKKANLNNTSTKDVKSSEVESHKCNTSRESMRLKQKRKACLNDSSTDNIKSLDNESNKCNTSRESIRLKQKREAKLNGNVTKNKR